MTMRAPPWNPPWLIFSITEPHVGGNHAHPGGWLTATVPKHWFLRFGGEKNTGSMWGSPVMFVSLKPQGGFVQYIYHKPLVPRYDTFKNNLANYSASPCFHDYLCHVEHTKSITSRWKLQIQFAQLRHKRFEKTCHKYFEGCSPATKNSIPGQPWGVAVAR